MDFVGRVDFTVTKHFDAPPTAVWKHMIDWEAHGEWIPATRVELDDGEPDVVGSTFTGYTGAGPVMLVDRMRITEINWYDSRQLGICTVEKLGPVLRGEAGFEVHPDGSGTRLEWFEAVTISWLPPGIDRIVSTASKMGFVFAMNRLAKQLTGSRAGGEPHGRVGGKLAVDN